VEKANILPLQKYIFRQLGGFIWVLCFSLQIKLMPPYNGKIYVVERKRVIRNRKSEDRRYNV